MDCSQGISFFTTWYNVFLYIFLIKYYVDKDLSFIYTYLLFSIPLFIIGEYIFWINKLWKKCGKTLKNAVFKSFIDHWVPLLFYFYFRHIYKERQIDQTSLLFVIFIFTLYASLYNIRKRYDI